MNLQPSERIPLFVDESKDEKIAHYPKINCIQVEEGASPFIELRLTDGSTSLIDVEDSSLVVGCRFYPHSRGYVNVWHRNFGKTLLLHRLLMGNPVGVVDHRNGDKRDNRRSNLRVATFTQNATNRGITRQNRSGLKGVHLRKRDGLWVSVIRTDEGRKFLGSFMSAEDAHIAYKKAARKYHGEFANSG